MNPLGLLAGLGALNALSGGELGAKFGGKAATGKRFTGLMDMLDGGGAGASGDRFEGGGLLSILGNLFAKPLEAQDRVERIAANASANNAVVDVLKDMAKGGTPTSRLDGKDFPMQYSGRGNVGMPRSGMEYSGRGLLAGSPEEMQYSGRGNVGMPRSGMEYSGRGMPSAAPAPSGLIAPQADTAPSMINPTDPLIGDTRNPSAYRLMDMSSQEMRPIIDPRGASPMSYEEYVPYISDLYRKEYGTAPTEQQLLSAYQVYTQSMGM